MKEMITYFLDSAEKMLHTLSNYVGLSEIRKARKQLDDDNIAQAVKTCITIFDYITGSEDLCKVDFINKAKYRQMIEGIEFYLKNH